MKLLIEFDVLTQVIDAPEYVINNRDALKQKFLRWIYNSNDNYVRKKFHFVRRDASGNKITIVQYDAKAFVDWINSRVIKDDEEKAVLIDNDADCKSYSDVPSIFF